MTRKYATTHTAHIATVALQSLYSLTLVMPTLLRFGGYQGPQSVHTRAMRVLGEALQRGLGDDISFEQIDNITQRGRNSTDLFSMVETGELELCYFASSYLVARVPSLKILDLPFQIADRAKTYRALDGELGRLLARDVEARTPFVVLGFWDNGFRHLTNWRRPIVRPRDCAGLRIRSMDNALHQDVFRSLGMTPQFIDVKDFPGAVARHEVDAQENPLTNTVNFKVFETHRHVSMTAHFHGTALLLAQRARHASWPAKVQDALASAIALATKQQRQFAQQEDEDCLKRLLDAGVVVRQPEAIDRAAFVAATASIVERESALLEPALLKALRG